MYYILSSSAYHRWALYVELHCHSNYSFHEGASFPHELLVRAKELGYSALALTDHDNLCGAMEFARTARSLDIQPIIGAEVTLAGGHHLTLLAETRRGYGNLCQLLTAARMTTDRREPELDTRFLSEHADGLILLTGCPKGMVPSLITGGKPEAEDTLREYLDWFGGKNVYVELQQNLVYGDSSRNKSLVELASRLNAPVVATNNVHYHIRDRHRLQDCLVAIRHNNTLEQTHRERRANSNFYLKSPSEMAALFDKAPSSLSNTLSIAERCQAFDLTKDLGYQFPDALVPDGSSQDGHLRQLCEEAATRRYGRVDQRIRERLDDELDRIKSHNLSGFFLMYHEIALLGREVMIDLGLSDAETPMEENPPGRGRGSSVAMLVGYLLGLSHIDPLQFDLGLDRFLPREELPGPPDIDLDFPRNIREELIKRVHGKYGFERAALTGMIATYKLKGAVRDLGKAFGLHPDDVGKLAKQADNATASDLGRQMKQMPDYKAKLRSPLWRHLVDMAGQLDGFPKYLAQHPGGMVISSSPLTEIVPVQPGAIDDRYVMQWDKDSIDDAGFVKIDFLALGALSQMQDALKLIERRTSRRPDLSRIDFTDSEVYDLIARADTIGIFQIESAAQMQTVTRIRPQNLVDMAHEVAAVRPGVGVNDGVSEYIARRKGHRPIIYDHPLSQKALERTLGVVLFQDQVNELAIYVAGMSAVEADRLRRAFGKRNNAQLIVHYWEMFQKGAATNGIGRDLAWRIFKKINGEYMFPESHAYAFGITAYQAAWLKRYYPLEFYVGLFNQQPMGFYNLETLKEDAKRHGVTVLNPEINESQPECTVVDDSSFRLGLSNVRDVGVANVEAIIEARQRDGPFRTLDDAMRRTGLQRKPIDNLVHAGAFDALIDDRRGGLWKAGLLYRPKGPQQALPLPVDQDMVKLSPTTSWDRMQSEYQTMGVHPDGHMMALLRPTLDRAVLNSAQIAESPDGAQVTVAGLVIRRQRPLAKAVFITLEDELGHIPLILWPDTYARYRLVVKSPLLEVRGQVSRREGTMNIIASVIRSLPVFDGAPRSKDWG